MKTKPNDTINPEIKSSAGYNQFTATDYTDIHQSGGLTKREYFASKNMAAIITHIRAAGEIDYEIVAKDAVIAADFLINELNK